MLVAHLPAGYLITHAAIRLSGTKGNPATMLLCAGLCASVLPDFDLLYFYFIDNRQHTHHSYWSHIPFYWMFLYFVSLPWFVVLDKQKLLLIVTVMFFNILGHLVLDTVVGHIRWWFPFSNQYFVLFHVPSRYPLWIWNFVLHWTFTIEIVLVSAAVAVWHGKKNRRRADKYLPAPTFPSISVLGSMLANKTRLSFELAKRLRKDCRGCRSNAW